MRRWPLLLAFACLAAQAAADEAAAARTDYMLNCQGCHLPDGRGYPGKVPDMRGIVGRFTSVPGGREFLVRVPGAANAPLSDARLARLMNWLLREYAATELPRDFVPFDAAEVGRLRRQPLTDVQGERLRLLRLVSAGAG
jgi:hypothetical protein